MSQEIEQNKDWVLNVPEQKVQALPEVEKSVIIHIPLESWSFNSFDRSQRSVSIVIGGNLVGNGNIPPLPPPNHQNLSFRSLSAPPIQRIESNQNSIRLSTSKNRSEKQSDLVAQLSSSLENALVEENERIKADINSLTKIGGDEKFSTSSALSKRYQEKEFVDFIPQDDRSYLDKLLLAIALLYSLVMFVALASKFNLNFVQLLISPVAKTAAEQPISNSDAQFVSYMKRSLEAIDRKAQAEETTIANDNLEAKENNLAVNKPTIASANSLPPVPTATLPAPWQTASLPVGNALSAVSSIPETTSFTPPPPPPSFKTTALPKKIANLPSPHLSETKTPSQASPSSTVKYVPAGYTLIGLLDLGEKSAALFKTNDTTQQIWVGETIGETGWILKSVTPRAVKISRKRQSRSLSVGDKF
jgi:hypothetical protein